MTISKDDLGGLQATVMVDANNKGLAVGRNGRNIEPKILAQRYFDISRIMINTPQRAMMEL